MNYSEQPGTQIGVQVTPLFIDGLAMMKLKITVTSAQVNQSLYGLTVSLHIIELVSKHVDHVERCHHHAKPTQAQ
jgi:hypothetical protein